MLTLYGEGRGFRVAWLLEEMQLPYRLRGVDLLRPLEENPEFLAINPAGFIPALVDGDTTMVESIAIMEYLLARHGAASVAAGAPPLCPAVQDANFGLYQQFLVMGEAGLAMAMYMVNVSKHLAPPDERDNWGARKALQIYGSRLALVSRQLARAPYMAGEAFTAADISVVYALQFAQRTVDYAFAPAELAYIGRCTGRNGYQRAMATCHATRGWAEAVAARRAAQAAGN